MEIPLTLLHVLAFVGTLVVLHIAGSAADFLFFHLLTPPKPLEGYRRRGPKPTYALITGASAGIGYGIAQALVRNGFGVILLGHKEDELASAAAKLRSTLVFPDDGDPATVTADAYVKTIVMDAQTATPHEMEAKLSAAIIDEGLRVSILVNNVGSSAVAPPPFRELATYSPDDVDGVIDLNARFMARLTTLMLPVLTHRGSGVDEHGMSFGTHRRSLILNISSAGMLGTPWIVMYGATKAFNWAFSCGLARELEADQKTSHIDCLCIVPGEVASQGNSLGQAWGSLDSDTFGRHVVERVDGAVNRGWREMSPYWLHHLQRTASYLVPERYVTKGVGDVMRKKKEAFNAVFGPKDE